MAEEHNPYEAPSTIASPNTITYGRLDSPYKMQDLSKLSITVIILLTVNLLTDFFSAITCFMAGNAYSIEQNIYYDAAGSETAISHAISIVDQLSLIAYILTIVFFCIWTHRAMKNAWYLRSQKNVPIDFSGQPMITPGWSVGWYFIPIAMFWMPFKGMHQIWKITFNDQRSSSILRYWWGAWIIAYIYNRILSRRELETFDEHTNHSYHISVSSLIWAIAAILLILIVRAINKAHTEEYDSYISGSTTIPSPDKNSPYSS